MAQDDDKLRTKRDRIERLRKRLGEPAESGAEEVMKLRNIIKALLDLLADEL